MVDANALKSAIIIIPDRYLPQSNVTARRVPSKEGGSVALSPNNWHFTSRNLDGRNKCLFRMNVWGRNNRCNQSCDTCFLIMVHII